MYLESHDYPIYYVNIDLRHQYGIFATESQTFLRAKRPKRRRARRNECFGRLILVLTNLNSYMYLQISRLSQNGTKNTKKNTFVFHIFPLKEEL